MYGRRSSHPVEPSSAMLASDHHRRGNNEETFHWARESVLKEVDGMTPDDFLAFAKKHQAEMVDLKFVDMLGTWQHCSFPIDLWNADTFKEGLGFDGSSIRGWMGIHESDMLAMPDSNTGCL